MGTITTKDGVEIYYKDWGKGQPIVFSHGWPLSADDWDAQMLFFLNHGYRVVAHDRRGHGRSSQVADGHDMDHYADDLAAVVAHLDLRDAIHVGHSTGGGEVAHYIARHGEGRVSKAALISAVPPLMVRRQPIERAAEEGIRRFPGGACREPSQSIVTRRLPLDNYKDGKAFRSHHRKSVAPRHDGRRQAHYDGIVASHRPIPPRTSKRSMCRVQ